MNREKLVQSAEIYKIRNRQINILDTATIRKPRKKDTLLFIPGAGGSIWNWKFQLKFFFDEGYRVVAYDPVGHGGSEMVDKYDFENHYQDMLAIFRKLKIKNLILITHSSSTQIALKYIKGNSKILKKLILFGVSLYDNDGKFWKRFISLPRLLGDTLYYLAFPFGVQLTKYLYFGKSTSYDTIKRFISENGVPKFKSLQIFKTYQGFDSSVWAKKFKNPTLIMTGDEDWLVPKQVNKEVYDAMPNSEFHIIENAGHLCFYEQPKLVNNYLDKFITKRNS